MEPNKLSELPFWFQIIAGFGIFFGTFAVAALGWVKKNALPGIFGNEESKKDAVVLSASIADKQSMQQLARAIDDLCVSIRRNDAEDSESMYALRRDHRELMDQISRLISAINQRAIL